MLLVGYCCNYLVDILVAHSFIIKYILDVVLDGCIIYKLLLVLTQRYVLYKKWRNVGARFRP